MTPTYEEHSGGHIFLVDRCAEFVSKNLTGTALYIVPPRMTWVGSGASAKVVFPTEIGVEYRVERAAVDRGTWAWERMASFQGTGNNAEWPMLPSDGAFVVRVAASNIAPP